MSTPVNYTYTHLADHLDGTSYDAISDDWGRGKVTARDLWRLAEALIDHR
ncbi:MAG: hypothetical protein WAU60_15035 [Candidatus Competibacter denitrificans]|jgi:hypothetical protein